MTPPAAPGIPAHLPDGIKAILQDLRGGRWTDEAQMQAFVNRRMADYNDAPQDELGGLSPTQTRALFDGDWIASGALRLAPPPAADVINTPFLRDARILLGALAHRPLKATTTGNLNRAALTLLFDLGATRDEWPNEPPPQHVTTELDTFPFHLVRVTCELDRLVRRYRGSFRITARGRDLATPDRAGELHRTLFLTFQRRLNHGYVYGGAPNPDLQQTIAFCFYRLGTLAAEWVDPRSIAALAVLPAAHPAPQDPTDFDLLPYQFAATVVEPLVRFGLLEQRQLPHLPGTLRRHEVRKTALFDQFLRISFPA
jgi:hypothetical protein